MHEHAGLRARHGELAPLQPLARGLDARVAHRPAPAVAFSFGAAAAGWASGARGGRSRLSSGLAVLRQYSSAAPTPLPGLILMPDVEHRHLRAGDAAEQHALVQIAEVADAEELARHPRQAGAQRQVVAPVGDVDHLRRVDVRPGP